MFDAGTGVYRTADYLETAELDVYLSHGHADHTWGLAYLEFMHWRRRVRDAAGQNVKVRMESVFSSLIDSSPRIRVHAAPEHREDVEELIGGSRDLA